MNKKLKVQEIEIFQERIMEEDLPEEVECISCPFSSQCDGPEFTPFCVKEAVGLIPSTTILCVKLYTSDPSTTAMLTTSLDHRESKEHFKTLREKYLSMSQGKTIEEALTAIGAVIDEDIA